MGVLTINVAAINGFDDRLGRLAINLASNTISSSQNLLDGTAQLLGVRLEAHGAGNLDDLVKGNRLVVLDVLLLLAVAGGLLQGLDNEGRCGGNDRDLGLTILDGELDSHAQAFLFTSLTRSRCEQLVVSCVRTQSPVALAMSSPTFLGERPRGPILGARADEAPTSPPVARRWLLRSVYFVGDRKIAIATYITLISLGSNLGAEHGGQTLLEEPRLGDLRILEDLESAEARGLRTGREVEKTNGRRRRMLVISAQEILAKRKRCVPHQSALRLRPPLMEKA